MGLYIKGMELPKEGDWITLRIFPNGQCFLYDWCGNDFDFMEHLTAVPIPTHGRLIDADALAKDYDSFPVRIDPWVWNELSHAPTIIPAEPCNDLVKPNIGADYPPSIPLKQVWTELFGEECE